MADYFSSFSFLIPTKNEDEREWLQEACKDLEAAIAEGDAEDLHDVLVAILTEQGIELEDLYPPYWELGTAGLWMHNDESCGHEFAAVVAQGYIRKFHPDMHLGLEIAHTCSKPRIDGFGGSAAFITKDNIRWGGTSAWLADQEQP